MSSPGRRRLSPQRRSATEGGASHARDHPVSVVRHQGEEAAKFYTSVFPNSRIVDVTPLRRGRAARRGDGDDRDLRARRAEVRRPERRAAVHVHRGDLVPGELRGPGRGRPLLEALSEGGEEGPCGWLKDRFGLSWQIVPTALPELLGDPDPEKAQRVMQAMLQMKKIEIDELERAAAAA